MKALPIIPKKTFEIKSKYLPKGKISLIPFTVGLEDILIQVKDAEDDREKMQAIKQVVQACNQTPGLDVEALPLFMIEEIFLRLRQNSIGEIIEQQYRCANELVSTTGDQPTECGALIPIEIDTREFKIVEEPDHTNTIVVADPIGIKFRYPSIALLEGADADTSDEVETILSCIESIFDSENVYAADEYKRDELKAFWDQLTLMQKKDVFDKFFKTMPHLHYRKELKCPKCGIVHEIEFDSVQEVFQ